MPITTGYLVFCRNQDNVSSRNSRDPEMDRCASDDRLVLIASHRQNRAQTRLRILSAVGLVYIYARKWPYGAPSPPPPSSQILCPSPPRPLRQYQPTHLIPLLSIFIHSFHSIPFLCLSFFLPFLLSPVPSPSDFFHSCHFIIIHLPFQATFTSHLI